MAKDEFDRTTQDLVAIQSIQAVNKQYGDNLPYQRDRLVNECKFFMRTAAESMLEAGKRLIILKENEPHGEYITALESLQLHPRTAQKMIKATLKFGSNANTYSHLGAAKLYELMLEDDDELAGLEDGGTIGGLKLDDIDRMSVREVKAALREARLAKEDQAKVMQDKNSKIDELSSSVNKLSRKLTEKQGLLAEVEPDTETARIRYEGEAIIARIQVDELRRKLPEAFRLMLAHTERTGVNHEAHMDAWLNIIEREVAAIREDFNCWGTYNPDAEEVVIDEADIPAHILEGNV